MPAALSATQWGRSAAARWGTDVSDLRESGHLREGRSLGGDAHEEEGGEEEDDDDEDGDALEAGGARVARALLVDFGVGRRDLGDVALHVLVHGREARVVLDDRRVHRLDVVL
jgi:hypothetical protein